VQAAPPEVGNELYESFVASVRATGVATATGQFRSNMQVELTNDGPVTLILDSRGLL
jgi:D-aminoacyl-tRNA deacylase